MTLILFMFLHQNEQDEDEFTFLTAGSNRSALKELSTLEQKSFPLISGWLDKRNHALPFNWHERWVIVKESFMLWTDVEAKCGDPKDKKERNKFNKHVSLLQVDSVIAVDKLKFKVVVSIGDKTREYLWRCKSEEKRNRWILELRHRMEHAKSMVDFLSADVADL